MTERSDDEHSKLLDDVDRWENRELGAEAKHARRSAPGRREGIDDKLGLTALALRLKTETADELERLAETEGVILKAYLRRILEAHVDEHRHTGPNS